MRKFDEWNYKGETKKDQAVIKKYLKKDIPLNIDDTGKVYTESGIYIADAIEDKENGVGIEMQNAWGGYRPGAGAPKTLPEGAKRRTINVTDAEWQKVKEFIATLRK